MGRGRGSSSSGRGRRGRSPRGTSPSTAPRSLRVESASRPDFLRTGNYADMFDALNCGKRSVTLNLKHPEGHALAKRLVVEWADAVGENFAPRAMRGLGLAYDDLVVDKPDLVMVSACLNGQTGPHRDYPGFGGQGAALSGFNYLTGWPDREPIGPFGTITDSLAPRFVATAMAAALLHHRATGDGVYVDLSQVECAAWTLSDWLLAYRREGVIGERARQRPSATRHCTACFACAGDDRWVAIAAWNDDELRRLQRDHRRRRRGVDGDARSARCRHRSCRPRASRPCPSRTSPTSAPTRNSRTAATSSRSTIPSSVPASTNATGSGSTVSPRATTAAARRSGRTTSGCSVTSSACRPPSNGGSGRRRLLVAARRLRPARASKKTA